jgi:hypothetical protein
MRFVSLKRRAAPLLLALVAGCTLLFFSSSSQAQGRPAILRPSDRPWFFEAGIGPSFYAFYERCRGFRGRGYLCRRTQFKLGLDIGYHFSGDFEGPAIGASIEQTFDDEFYFFNPAFKFWWDIEIADMAIYVTPFAKAGYAMGSTYFDNFIHGFNIGAGVEGRLVLHNRGLVFLRPVQIDTYLGDFEEYDFDDVDFVVTWTILLGGGVVWGD